MKLLALAIALATSATAFADQRPREVFAIIVTNNRSSQLGRPDLRYADDDGAKYYEVLRLLAPAANVHLLTELDRDTRALFPKVAAVARPPTQREVIDAAADVARRARSALAAGRTVEVYFVFAGHGDVDRGTGFIELADGSFSADQIDKHVLSGIPATHTHVILDSCNSFFVINARKPGGHRFATPNDITDRFAKKLPHVGVFLSTSAEQEVYEWSELQSGIFSHAVRSGLLGAADVDRDGSISYAELRAFVTIASAKVKNPLYRPNVFARGPAGKNAEPLVDLRHVETVSVTVGPDETRLTVRDKEALPWIDAHTERGATIELRVPVHAIEGGSIVEVDGSSWALPSTPAPAVALATLVKTERLADARGPEQMLRMLFSEPFGPKAMAQVDQYLPPVQTFGVAQEDAERMDLLIAAAADNARSNRLVLSTVTMAGSVFLGGTAAYLRFLADRTDHTTDDAMLVMAGALAVVGTVGLFATSDGERLQADFRQRMAQRRGDDGYIVADTERRLARIADRAARQRKLVEYMGWACIGIAAAGVVAWELWGPDTTSGIIYAAGAGVAVLGGGMALSARLLRAPEERIYGLWRDDPGIRRIPKFGVAPTRSGGMLVLGGEF